MAIENQDSSRSYVCDGTTTRFATLWPVIDASAGIEVVEEDSASGATRTLTHGVEYTVAGGNGAAATVVAPAPPPSGKVWHLLRTTARTQPAKLPAAGALPSARVEAALDRVVAVVQEIWRRTLRTVRGPDYEAAWPVLPGWRQRAGRLLRFDSAGLPSLTAYTDDQLGRLVDAAAINLALGGTHKIVGDAINDTFALPVAWGRISRTDTLFVTAGGVPQEPDAYALIDGGAFGQPGRTYIKFPGPVPKRVPVLVRIPPRGEQGPQGERGEQGPPGAGANGVEVTAFLGPDNDMGAAITRAARYALANGIRTLRCGPGRFRWRTSADMSFDGSRDPFTDGTLHLIGAGEQTTLFEVDLSEPFPALDCVGNTRMLLRDFRMFHSATCRSTASIFCAKPGGHPFGTGREPRLENVSVIRPRNLSGSCFFIMACDLASLRACEGQGRQPLRWGSYVPPGLATVGGAYPRGTLSKFQAVDPSPDYTAMYLYDSHLWGTDFCIDNWGSTGSRMYIYGGYNTLFGGAPDVIDGARGHIHMRRLGGGGEGGTIRTWGTRFELGTDTGPVDGIIIATGSLSHPVFYGDPDVDIPVFYVPSGSIVASPEVRIFSAYSSPPIFAGAGTVQVPNIIGNRSIAAVETTVTEPSLSGAYSNNVLGAPSGDRLSGDVFRPGLAVGANGAGFLTWENLRKYGPLITMRVGYRGFDFGSTDEVVGQNQTISPTSPTEYGTPGTAGYYAGGEGYGAAGGDVYLSGGWSDQGLVGYGNVWIASGYGNKKIAKFITGAGNWPDYFIFTPGSNETAGRSRIGTSGNNLLLEPATRVTQVGGTLSVGTGTENRSLDLRGSNGGNSYIGTSAGSLQIGGSAILGGTGSTIGFYGTTPAPKPNVTGSWDGNPAGQSLAAALATLGLITNSTTS